MLNQVVAVVGDVKWWLMEGMAVLVAEEDG